MSGPTVFELIRHGRQEYAEAFHEQKARVAAIADGRAGPALILTEHEPVFTLGRSANRAFLRSAGAIPVVESDRGGEVTYHGPGQLTVYVVTPLDAGVRRHVWRLEETALRALAALGVRGERDEAAPGVWAEGAKIAALGVRVARKVAYHGLSINRDPELKHYAGIVPCGLTGREVTSLARLGFDASREELERQTITAFEEVFEATARERRPHAQS